MKILRAAIWPVILGSLFLLNFLCWVVPSRYFVAAQSIPNVPQGDIDPGINRSCPNGDCTSTFRNPTAIMCYDSTKGLIECPVVPFDVPPLQVKKTINPMDMSGSISEVHCMECPYEVTVLECADKSRFKLMSEDGKWHCLNLVHP